MCESHSDEFENLTLLCFAVLETGEWEDEPSDTTRTLGSMQSASIKYCEAMLPLMEDWPIYVEDVDKPNCQVGIEQHFDVVLEFADGVMIRYVGTIDGLVRDTGRKRWCLEENKTSVRLSEAWAQSFDMRHQVTGYCAASTSVFGFPVMASRILGVKIKPTNAMDDIRMPQPIERDSHAIHRWGQWVRSMSATFDRYKDDWEYADRYTHACFRYYRTCSLLPFCCDTPEGRKETFTKTMVMADQTPSERAVSND